jgi:hypothetical protein
MSLVNEYRQIAATCQQDAAPDKQQWLSLAEKWLKLAEAIDRSEAGGRHLRS